MALHSMFRSTTLGKYLMNRSAISAFRLLSNFPDGSPQSPSEPPPKTDPSPNLFILGLSKKTTNESLRAAFEKFGKVTDAKVVTDRVTGRSKCYGFVRYATQQEADKGREGMDGKFLDGWVIFVEYARPKSPRNPNISDGLKSMN
eukprot:TRINITY_DN36446_c0_g1_i1.p1 TRINITY_DN36446_c0_g1~~TRINITY_DN36446_c0_g1_i1.p1  ORF type:complete len:145 (-),score=27.93 TRINITY_DN36446_c0_g1_i1:143-577(-)